MKVNRVASSFQVTWECIDKGRNNELHTGCLWYDWRMIVKIETCWLSIGEMCNTTLTEVQRKICNLLNQVSV